MSRHSAVGLVHAVSESIAGLRQCCLLHTGGCLPSVSLTRNVIIVLIATYGYESWTLRKNEETRLVTFEMKGLRKILRVSWTAKKTNEWVLNKAGVKRELLDTVKARKLAYYGHTMRKHGSCLEKEIMRGTMPGARRRVRPGTAWINNIKMWTRLSVEESIRIYIFILSKTW